MCRVVANPWCQISFYSLFIVLLNCEQENNGTIINKHQHNIFFVKSISNIFLFSKFSIFLRVLKPRSFSHALNNNCRGSFHILFPSAYPIQSTPRVRSCQLWNWQAIASSISRAVLVFGYIQPAFLNWFSAPCGLIWAC